MPRGPERDSWDQSRDAEAYAQLVREGALYRQLARGLVDLVAAPLGVPWLDLACGTGIVSEMLLAREGRAARGVGIDRAPAMLTVARRTLPDDQVELLQADPAQLPLAAASCGAAVSSAAFWHFPGLGRVLGELARVTRPGGRLAFNVPLSQLAGASEAPAPLMVALSREGERRFGRAPAPAGPVLERGHLLELARAAGFRLERERRRGVAVTQAELASLMRLAPLSARLYPDASASERQQWVTAASARIDPAEVVCARWWEVLLRRRDGDDIGADRPARTG